MALQGWKLLKTIVGFGDEDDYAALQASPPANEMAAIGFDQNRLGVIRGVEVVVEWLDAMGDVFSDPMDRGVFDLQFIVKADYAFQEATGDTIHDSAVLAAQIGFRPVFIDVMGGTQIFFGTRMTTITAPVGANGFRVLYREVG